MTGVDCEHVWNYGGADRRSLPERPYIVTGVWQCLKCRVTRVERAPKPPCNCLDCSPVPQ